jgi:hypothetical protein
MTDRLLGIDACSDTDALEVSDRCIVDHSTDDRVESWDVSSPVQLPNVDVAFESGVDDRTGWQDVIELRVDNVSGRDYLSSVGGIVADSDIDVDACDVTRCQCTDNLGRCYSLSDHLDQLRSRHVPDECLMLSVQSYLPRSVETRRCRGLTRKVFDPGGM